MKDRYRGIVRVPILPWGMVNAFIVYSEEGSVIVDAGLPDSAAKFKTSLEKIGRTLSDVRLIVVTHGHVDHAGAAASLRESCGAPILAHEDEKPFLLGEKAMTLCPTRPFGRLLLRSGGPTVPYERFSPDIVLRGTSELDLTKYGIKARVVPTPGHTPGSVSVVRDDGAALVGDLVASGILLGGIAFSGRPQRPPFEEQPALVADQLESLINSGCTQFFLGHGGPLGSSAVKQHASRLRKVDVQLPAL
jgi:hydroxyacylglutathione hydrolase